MIFICSLYFFICRLNYLDMPQVLDVYSFKEIDAELAITQKSAQNQGKGLVDIRY
jgi:hypothetical protein